jgi:hypothetical protein
MHATAAITTVSIGEYQYNIDFEVYTIVFTILQVCALLRVRSSAATYSEVLIQATLSCVVFIPYTLYNSEVARLVGEGEPVMIRGVLQWLNSIRLVVLLVFNPLTTTARNRAILSRHIAMARKCYKHTSKTSMVLTHCNRCYYYHHYYRNATLEYPTSTAFAEQWGTNTVNVAGVPYAGECSYSI